MAAKLVKARTTNFKSIEDSGWFPFGDVTALVGKNESGKTAVMQSLAKLNPVRGQSGSFNVTLEYPRKELNRYKKIHNEQPAVVIEAVFELDEAAVAELAERFGEGVVQPAVGLGERQFSVSKTYENQLHIGFELDEALAVKHLVSRADLPDATAKQMAAHGTTDELKGALEALGGDPPQAVELLERMNGEWRDGEFRLAVADALNAQIPRFLYFDEYSVMEGRISVPELQRRRDEDELTEADRTFLALLEVVGAELEAFEDASNYEDLIAELEAASNRISDELFTFWSQNKELAVDFDISAPDPEAAGPLSEGTNLHVRIRNNRHRVTVPFDQRSAGFVWFFSFLVYFEALEEADQDEIVLLLDEPGLNLHPTAQGDFLRFTDERLATEHQVIYTTHSPFMVDATRLERARTVVDVDGQGTKVSDQVFRADRETVFPLQAALGYEITQSLFVAPDNLLVEGPADLIYLQLLSETVMSEGGQGLDERWVIVPVGGLDKISAFVSLLGGSELNTSVLIDVTSASHQRIENLRANGHLGKNSLIQVGDVTGAKDADIEDLFDPGFYVSLVNGAYIDVLAAKLTVKDLGTGDPRICKRIERYFDENNLGRFSHYHPASHLLREQAKYLPKLTQKTLERAETLFKRINETLADRSALAELPIGSRVREGRGNRAAA